jgi:hypothetical protein
MGKRALLIGINYRGTSSELLGCINDTASVATALKKRGYRDQDITILTDDTEVKPTRFQIMKSLFELVTCGERELFFGYSGHGSYQKDWSGDEADGRDECLVPLDSDKAGYISDDHLRALFTLLPKTSRLTALIDACHSGSAFDLAWSLWTKNSSMKLIADENYKSSKANIFMISGCMDDQTSADTVEENKNQGALTWAFLNVLDTSKTWRQLITETRRKLKEGGYSQIPNFSSGRLVSLDSKILI